MSWAGVPYKPCKFYTFIYNWVAKSASCVISFWGIDTIYCFDWSIQPTNATKRELNASSIECAE